MKKIALGFMVVAIPLLSGCSLPTLGTKQASGESISFARSSDGATTFESKSKLDEKTDFASADVLSLAMDAKDTRHMFVGTKETGMFASDNSGDTWRQIKYPPTRIYGLIIDVNNSQHLFATGEWEGRGKIYQSTDTGATWKEVYTEPANGTVITSLAQNPFNTEVIYAGTSAGMIIRSNDSGATWKNIDFKPSMNGSIIWKIAFDTHRINTIYFFVDKKGVFVSDGDSITIDPTEIVASDTVNEDGSSIVTVNSTDAVSFAIDPSQAGVLYIGSPQGVSRSEDFGKTWKALNVIESSKKFPIGAIAVNPKNANEIIYISALTLYKSNDTGAHWSTHQISSDKSAYLLQYDSYDSNIIYIGFKK